MSLALKAFMQNDGDFVAIILLYYDAQRSDEKAYIKSLLC